jgi:hypothetical protein
MAKQTMRRNAADNVYLHKDFHGALSAGIQYLHLTYGEEAVREYLREFALHFYAPLTRAVKHRGLQPLREHLELTFGQEGADFHLDFCDESITLHVEACPAITHMRKNGTMVAPLLCETSRTVYATILEGTPYTVEWLCCDDLSGRCVMRFGRKEG